MPWIKLLQKIEESNTEYFGLLAGVINSEVETGIIKGIYQLKEIKKNSKLKVQLLASGPMVNEAIEAAKLLESDWGVSATVWSVTSYSELHKESEDVRRWNILHPKSKPRKSYLEKMILNKNGPVIAVSDYVKLVAEQISPYIKCSFVALGTDGFGRSDTRKNLRKFFEVDKEHLVAYGLSVLAKEQLITSKHAKEAIKKYNIDGDKPMPTKL